MKNYRFAFYVTTKYRTSAWAGYLAQGANLFGDTVDMIDHNTYTGPLDIYDGACRIGVNSSTKRIMEEYLAAGKHFLYFDKGYTGRNYYWRMSVDAWQPLAYFQRFMRPDDRMKEANFIVADRSDREGTFPILFAGGDQNGSNLFNLGDVNDYNRDVLLKLRANTDRPIIYRPNPSWYRQHQEEYRDIHSDIEGVTLSTHEDNFIDLLKSCHLLVTHSSSASTTAFMRGVPIMVLGPGMGRSMALTEDQFDQIESPLWPKYRLRHQFFSDLAYCQWTVAEYQSGEAWEELRWILSSLEQRPFWTPANEVIDQYKVMHKHPNYFKGLTTLRYGDAITALVSNKVKTILDYGSGKGAQYEPPYNLHYSWPGVRVRCYDPGVPQFAKLPTSKFDGVICCDVMEHVSEDTVPKVLRQIIGFAEQFVFFAIATAPAGKTLPDGRNCHLTIRPKEWWTAQLDAVVTELGVQDTLKIVLITAEEIDDVG